MATNLDIQFPGIIIHKDEFKPYALLVSFSSAAIVAIEY